MENVNLIITGVNGFIGSHVAEKCKECGYNVIGIDIGSTASVENIVYKQLNLLSDTIDGLLKEYMPYAVIHCAGMADVNYSMTHPESDFNLNVIVAKNILYSIKNYTPEARFIYMSSAGVYGNPNKLPIQENFERNPISPYALHKVLVEDICDYFIRQYALDIRILRIFSAYGNGLKKQIFWDMGQKLGLTGKLNLFGTGNETRDFIHIEDLSNAILLIMKAEKRDFPIINVANGMEISIRQIAVIFSREMGYSEDVISFTNQNREGNPSNWMADITRLRKLGYVQSVSLEGGIGLYVNWLRQNGYVR